MIIMWFDSALPNTIQTAMCTLLRYYTELDFGIYGYNITFNTTDEVVLDNPKDVYLMINMCNKSCRLSIITRFY